MGSFLHDRGPRCLGTLAPSNRNNHAGPSKSPLTTCEKINCLIGLPCRQCVHHAGREKSFLTACFPLIVCVHLNCDSSFVEHW